MSYGLKELQGAVYTLLDGDVTLNSLVSGVYDRVPDRTLYPYVVIGDARAQDWSCHDVHGIEARAMLHIYSRKGGRKQALEIASRLYELLHDASLTLSGHDMALARHEASDVSWLNDGRTSHVSMTFRLLVQEQ